MGFLWGKGRLSSGLGLVGFCGLIPGQAQGLVGFHVQRPQGLMGFCEVLGSSQGQSVFPWPFLPYTNKLVWGDLP